MKKFILLFILFVFKITYVSADRPIVALKVSSSDDTLMIQSDVLWNIISDEDIPDGFFIGNDTKIVKRFKLGKKKGKIYIYFPEQLSGRNLNKTTTVFIKVYLKRKLIYETEHFGQTADDFVRYDTDILCRSNFLKLYISENKKLQLIVKGEYSDKARYTDEKYLVSYVVNSLNDKHISDETLTCKVIENGPLPKTIPNVAENIIIDGAGKGGLYSFKTQIDEDIDLSVYDWEDSFDFQTEKSNESVLQRLFNPFTHKYIPYKNKDVIRVYDPVVTFFCNMISFNPKNIETIREGSSYAFSNITNDVTVLDGVKILNPVSRKRIKIDFFAGWQLDSLKVYPGSINVEKTNTTVVFSGEAMDSLDYCIYLTKRKQ